MMPYRENPYRPQDDDVPVLDLRCAYTSVDDLLSDLNGETAEMQEKPQNQNRSD